MEESALAVSRSSLAAMLGTVAVRPGSKKAHMTVSSKQQEVDQRTARARLATSMPAR